MESLLQFTREFFKAGKGISISLGISSYLITCMMTVHFAAGLLATSYQFVGKPMTCFGPKGFEMEPICNSQFNFMEFGHKAAVEYSRGTKELTFAFYKLTNWIFIIIGKCNTIPYIYKNNFFLRNYFLFVLLYFFHFVYSFCVYSKYYNLNTL